MCCSVFKHNLASYVAKISAFGKENFVHEILVNLLQFAQNLPNFLPPKFCIVQYQNPCLIQGVELGTVSVPVHLQV